MPCMVLASMTRDQHDPTFRFTTSRFFEQQHNLILYIIFDRHWQTLRSISGVNKSIASWLGSMVSIHHIIFRWRRSCFTLRGILPLSLAESSFTFVPLVNRCSFFFYHMRGVDLVFVVMGASLSIHVSAWRLIPTARELYFLIPLGCVLTSLITSNVFRRCRCKCIGPGEAFFACYEDLGWEVGLGLYDNGALYNYV